MSSFVSADSEYRNAVEAPGLELAAAFAAAQQVPSIDLAGDDISRAILLRLRSFFNAQDTIKTTLDKVYAAPAADFLVETVLFYLRVTFEKLQPSLKIASERNIVKRRGSLRPDISIWLNDQVVAAVECKTQLGWNRSGWLHDFENRESRLIADFPDAKLFLMVMTANNWSGFGNDGRVGRQFFVMLDNIWPRDFEESMSNAIVHRTESLIGEILRHADGLTCRLRGTGLGGRLLG